MLHLEQCTFINDNDCSSGWRHNRPSPFLTTSEIQEYLSEPLIGWAALMYHTSFVYPSNASSACCATPGDFIATISASSSNHGHQRPPLQLFCTPLQWWSASPNEEASGLHTHTHTHTHVQCTMYGHFGAPSSILIPAPNYEMEEWNFYRYTHAYMQVVEWKRIHSLLIQTHTKTNS